MALDAFSARHFAATHFFALGHPSVDAAESAAVDSGDISRAFAVDYSPLKLTPYQIAQRRRFLQKIINDMAKAKQQRERDDELALLALYAVIPKAA